MTLLSGPALGLAAALALLFAACGDNGDGNGDTVLTGFSGVLIFGIVAWLIWRWARNKS